MERNAVESAISEFVRLTIDRPSDNIRSAYLSFTRPRKQKLIQKQEGVHILRDIIVKKRNNMKFPWSKPSAYEVVSTLFNEFTPEERAILDGKDCFIPHMYSFLMEKSKRSELSWSFDLDMFRYLLLNLFSKREEIRDPKFQRDLFHFY